MGDIIIKKEFSFTVSHGVPFYELKDHLTTFYDLHFLNKEIFEKGIFLIENAKLTLNGYIKFVQASKRKKMDEV